MRRMFWFGLGVFAGLRLARRGHHEWQAVKADPIGELDRFIRTTAPLAKRIVRLVRTSIEV